ncbi:hypothetical protein [Mycobacteroides immunogenum]|nr:hypothetical protein [Mycobacteroides immunogenum]
MRNKFRSYAGDLADTSLFDEQMQAAVVEMQARYRNSGKLSVDAYIPGVINAETKYVMGYLPRPVAVKPVIFTVEGHLSDMWAGPSASIGAQLSAEGLAFWQPVGYNSGALPFDNKSGVNELVRLLSSTVLTDDSGKAVALFPAGTPWGITGFSQGAMVVCEFMMQYVLPEGAPLHWRLKDFKRGLCFGNPRREKDRVCPWSTDPPSAGTQGIMDVTFDTSKTDIADRWQEHPRKGDMFAENTTDAAGKDKTAIAKIICENSWVGGPSALFARVLALFGNPVGESFAAIKAIFDAIMFLVRSPNPHYSTVAEPGDFDWMRGIAA